MNLSSSFPRSQKFPKHPKLLFSSTDLRQTVDYSKLEIICYYKNKHTQGFERNWDIKKKLIDRYTNRMTALKNEKTKWMRKTKRNLTNDRLFL